MITRTRLLIVALLAMAVLLTFLKIPLASSQGTTIVAAQVEEALPITDLNSGMWQAATAVKVPLSAQIVAKPMFAQANVKAVDVRALYNSEQIAFLVEWEDDTLDESTVRVQDFSDAVAIQFPLVEGQPFFCMGQQDGNVNIWHWKADWQASIAEEQDVDTVYPNMYVDGYTFADEEAGAASSVADYEDVNYVPALAAGNLMASATYASPVEDLIAGSFGSLTSQPAEMQNVAGHGEYIDGKWRVIFARDLLPTEGDDAHFETGQVYSLAFAAWDGANEERNGQKSTSQWVSLQLGGATAESEGTDSSAAPAPESGSRESTANNLEGVGFVIIPIVILVLLFILLAGGFFILTKLPGKK